MLKADISNLDTKKYILIKGARMHNLKNIDLAIPKNKLVVITGLSGSGKSSLAFDTLFADGQRRYVESLSAYARQFLGRMSKPDVDFIKGIAPAIAIEQKVNTRNPRSTVGTSTEIYEYLKLLFARIGATYSPVSGKLVERNTVTQVTDFILGQKADSQVLIYVPLEITQPKRSINDYLSVLLQQGFSRVIYDGKIVRIEEILKNKFRKKEEIYIIIDRVIIRKEDEDLRSRVSDSVQTAFFEGHGTCLVDITIGKQTTTESFSSKFEADGISFEEPNVNFFSFNNPYGACKTCEGFGSVIGIDPDLVIPNKSLSVYEDAIACWKGEKMSEWKDVLIKNAYKFDFPIHKPVYDLTPQQYQLLWTGNEHFYGLNDFFKYVEEQTYKIQYRVMLSRYRGKTICPDCQGTRLRKDAGYVKVSGKSINELVLLPVVKLADFFNHIKLSDFELKVSRRLLIEIQNRLQFLIDVGLGYLTLNRLSNTLSGGESQRINLATSLGSSLVGSIYILDEPSIGLHPRDTHLLIKVLKQLRDTGNTVIVVEHDEEIIKEADEIIDIGPEAGVNGGKLIFQGDFGALSKSQESLTAKYMTGKLEINIPGRRRNWKNFIELTGAREHNLKGLDVKFPLNTLTVLTGVSGSGKTTLVKQTLYPVLKKLTGGYGEKTGKYNKLEGDYNKITAVELVDQNPIGRSSRSNPATYVKAYDDIRNLFANQQLSKIRGYKPGYFSFNIEGGRCEECEGEGVVKIEMQFMADIYLTCESCNGKRFKDEVLDVKYRGKDINDILNMTINEAINFFGSAPNHSNSENKIVEKLHPLKDVGLGYLGLGQSSSTLSGGEAQRVKLALFLSKGSSDSPTLFIFDEPTTGLHFHDINKLLTAFDALIEKGHSVIVIEHNMDVIKYADWIIDLGPEGGDKGGNIVFEGTPENLILEKNSYTGKFLKPKLN
ncbi:MAG: excinuclease ABC subunit UvrA [Bacteroidales bacterium]|nr:excinuclease ABC subunit UvrA [Bacteroidales bacterium]